MLVVPIGASGGGIFGGSLTDLTNRAGTIWDLSSMTGYSRELETEADTEGLRLMVRAGYDPSEAVKVFEILQREIDESKIKEPFLYGTHPHVQARIENYRRLVSAQSGQEREEGRFKNTDEFLGKIEPVILDDANLNLQIGRIKAAQAGIEKVIQRRSDCGRAYFLLGEVYRRSGKDEPHTERAISAYCEAIRLSPTDALTYRELGLLYRALNRREEACAAFEQYLTLSPKAVDASIVRGYLTELNKP